MNVQQLHVFMEVGSGRTLAEAAERLGLKQPTVSFHLRKLEEELGVELFRKHSRSLFPTDAAMELLPYAKRIVFLMDEARLAMSERREKGEGRLRLGASYTPATYVLPPYLAAFREFSPKVSQMLVVKQAAGILALLRNYELDVAIVSLPDRPQPRLIVQKLMEDELQLLLSPQHPLAATAELAVGQLEGETFLLHESGSTSRTLADEWAQRVGLSWASVMELGAIETIKEALKCNMGLGVLPGRSVLREVGNGELVMRELPGYRNERYICLVYRDEEQLSPHVRSFIEFIRSELTKKNERV